MYGSLFFETHFPCAMEETVEMAAPTAPAAVPHHNSWEGLLLSQ